jgi:hypothetical protein
MQSMFQNIVDRIRVRNQAEWKAFFLERYELLRSLVREHGEISALVGFGLGIGIVLFFKLFVLLVVLAALAYSLIMLIAKE